MAIKKYPRWRRYRAPKGDYSLWGMKYAPLFNWDERKGFRFTFGLGRSRLEFTSKKART